MKFGKKKPPQQKTKKQAHKPPQTQMAHNQTTQFGTNYTTMNEIHEMTTKKEATKPAEQPIHTEQPAAQSTQQPVQTEPAAQSTQQPAQTEPAAQPTQQPTQTEQPTSLL